MTFERWQPQADITVLDQAVRNLVMARVIRPWHAQLRLEPDEPGYSCYWIARSVRAEMARIADPSSRASLGQPLRRGEK